MEQLKTLDEIAEIITSTRMFGTDVWNTADEKAPVLYYNSEGEWFEGNRKIKEQERIEELRAQGAVFRCMAMKYTGCEACPRADFACVRALRLPSRAPLDIRHTVDILYVFSQPDYERDRYTNEPVSLPGLPGDLNSALARAQRILYAEDQAREQFKIGVTFAALCAPQIADDKPGAAVLKTCHPNVHAEIARLQPKLIVAFGSTVVKQLGLKQKFNDIRGRIFEADAVGLPAPVLVTFSEGAVAAAPGLYRTFLQDLRNGYSRLFRKTKPVTLEELSKDYVLPQTVDEALAVCREILTYQEVMPNGQRGPSTISVDTETTSLHPEKEGARIIAFCFSWAPGRSATLLFDHPLAPPEYLARLPELTQAIGEVLACPKPKVLHNAKFDLKWIELKYGMPVANVAWCSLLGEHLLDEDKKGNYGLKALTAVWLPQFCGYEDKLYDILEAEEASDGALGDIDRILEALPEGKYEAFATALREYRAQLQDYEAALEVYEGDYAAFVEATQEWKAAREAHKAAVAEWEARPRRPKKPEKPRQPKGASATDADFAAYPERLRAYEEALAAWEGWQSPPKPVFDQERPQAPDKPTRLPKPPADPRTQKERDFTTDAGFEKLPLHELQLYGAVDADVTRRLSREQNLQIMSESKKLAALNTRLFSKGPKNLMSSHAIPASRVLGHMEYHGVRIDFEYAKKLEVFLTEVVDNSHAALLKAVEGWRTDDGAPFNPQSGAHIADVLYDRGWRHPSGEFMPPVACLDFTKKTKQRSTTEAALKPHLTYDEVLNPDTGKHEKITKPSGYFIEQLSLYKKATKARDTFLTNLMILASRDGRVHTSFHLNGTGTGRLASTNQNLQNIPKKLAGKSLKQLFVPDSDEFLFVNADYKGAEVRVFTVYAPDPALIEALNNGLDMHSFFASRVFVVAVRVAVGNPELTEDQAYELFQNRDNEKAIPDAALRALLDKLRTQIKRVVFGILYGAGPGKIAETIGASLEDAKAIIELLFTMFPAIRAYIENTNRDVELYRQVETVFGRRRRFPLIESSRHKSRAQRQAGNFKIQSTSSDIVISQLIEMHEMIHSDRTWPEWGIHKPLHTYGVRLLLTVHDSIVLQWPKKLIRALEPWMRYYGETRVREKYPWMPVPFAMDIEVGPSYGECKPLAKYLAELPHETDEEELEILTELRMDAFDGEA